MRPVNGFPKVPLDEIIKRRKRDDEMANSRMAANINHCVHGAVNPEALANCHARPSGSRIYSRGFPATGNGAA